ncbi:hypothetical protein LPJ79_003481 [Coemansia sp. RSA 1821]|nr:hypothetical protein LPJ68_002865 [Coemansia sp. RSA 1086]KAJ1749744.1 hypothetical protein LPJ79_003481 [Coemansia sp. RSA 1821]
MPMELANQVKMLSREKAIYSNCRVLDINGDLLFRASHKRLEWYLSRNLADRIDDTTIQLNFVNKGNGRKDEPFYLQDMQNNCSICGTAGSLTMHHVVPHQYRTFMEESIKSRSSHDLLPTCTVCHDKYERHAVRFKKHLAQCFGAPLDGVGWIERKDIGRGGRAAATLLSPSLANIPAERVGQLQSIVEQVVSQHVSLFSNDVQLTISQCIDSGKRLCEEQSVLNELISMPVRIRGPEFRTHDMFSKATKLYLKTHWYRSELIPIYAITAGAVGVCTFFASRALRSPDVVWNKKDNPYPWLDVQPNENVKLMDPNNRFEKQWSRSRL